MIVRARQRRTLLTMEKQLEASEPHLLTMFAIFARLTRDETPTGAEPMPRHRRLRCSPWLQLSLPVGIAAALVGMVIGLSPHAVPACGRDGYAQASAMGPAIVSCPRLPQHQDPETARR